MKYKLIIYDLDGTLLDSKADLASAVNVTRQHMGLDVLPDTLIHSFVGQGAGFLVSQSMPELSPEDCEVALSYFRNHYYNNALEKSSLYPGAREMLRDMQRAFVKQAVLTNKPQIPTNHILEGLGASSYFELVIGAENGFKHKPDAESTQHILNTCGVSAAETLYVGDSDIDLQTAMASGLDCILLRCGFTPAHELDELQYDKLIICNDFAELRELPDLYIGLN